MKIDPTPWCALVIACEETTVAVARLGVTLKKLKLAIHAAYVRRWRRRGDRRK